MDSSISGDRHELHDHYKKRLVSNSFGKWRLQVSIISEEETNIINREISQKSFCRWRQCHLSAYALQTNLRIALRYSQLCCMRRGIDGFMKYTRALSAQHAETSSVSFFDIAATKFFGRLRHKLLRKTMHQHVLLSKFRPDAQSAIVALRKIISPSRLLEAPSVEATRVAIDAHYKVRLLGICFERLANRSQRVAKYAEITSAVSDTNHRRVFRLFVLRLIDAYRRTRSLLQSQQNAELHYQATSKRMVISALRGTLSSAVSHRASLVWSSAHADRRCIVRGLLALVRHVKQRWILRAHEVDHHQYIATAQKLKNYRKLQSYLTHMTQFTRDRICLRDKANLFRRYWRIKSFISAMRECIQRIQGLRNHRMYADFFRSMFHLNAIKSNFSARVILMRRFFKSNMKALLFWKYYRYYCTLQCIKRYVSDMYVKRQKILEAKSSNLMLVKKKITTCLIRSSQEGYLKPSSKNESSLAQVFKAWRSITRSVPFYKNKSRVNESAFSIEKCEPQREAVDPRSKPRNRVNIRNVMDDVALERPVEELSTLSNSEKRQLLGKSILGLVEELKVMRNNAASITLHS